MFCLVVTSDAADISLPEITQIKKKKKKKTESVIVSHNPCQRPPGGDAFSLGCNGVCTQRTIERIKPYLFIPR